MNSTDVSIVLLCMICIMLVWDLWLYLDKKEGNTISQTTIRLSAKYPIIAFLAGCLIGHLWL